MVRHKRGKRQKGRRQASSKQTGSGQKSSQNGSYRKAQRGLSLASLPNRSQAARDRALHVLSIMRRDPDVSLAHASKLEGIKPETVQKYLASALTKSNGKFRVSKADRFSATQFVPDAQGNRIPVNTKSSKERTEISQYLRDRGRYLRGDITALSKWQGKTIGGVELVTDGRTIKALEPELSDFSLYRTFNGGA